MLRRKVSCISCFRACSDRLDLFLYFCLILSLTWYESGSNILTSTGVARYLNTYTGFAVSQDDASHRQPSLLCPTPKLQSGTRLRPENRDDDLPSIQPLPCRVVASDSSCLPSPRIDPVV
jgi:hypothetical protein